MLLGIAKAIVEGVEVDDPGIGDRLGAAAAE
jgi:hypothetical protein